MKAGDDRKLDNLVRRQAARLARESKSTGTGARVGIAPMRDGTGDARL